MRIEHTTEIGAAPETLWRLTTEVGRWPDLMPAFTTGSDCVNQIDLESD